MKKLIFISTKNQKMTPAKLSRKNKHRQFYKWKLERFVNNKESENQFDVFPSTATGMGIQHHKVEILYELNGQNIFDFEYTPLEKDYLSINNNKNDGDYLNLIFLNGKWVEEYYACFFTSPFDEYVLLNTGELEFNNSEFGI